VRARLSGEDVFLWGRDLSQVGAEAASATEALKVGQMTAVAVALKARESELSAELLAITDPAGAQRLAKAFGAPQRHRLLKISPRGAVAYAALASDSEKLREWAQRPTGCSLDELLKGTGLDCDALFSMISGELSAAVWLDVARIWTDLSRGAPGDKASYLPLVAALGVRDRSTALGFVHRAGAAKGAAKVVDTDQAVGFEKPVTGGTVGVGLSGEALLLGTGEAFGKALRPSAEQGGLEAALAAELPPDALSHALLFLDVKAIVDALRFPPKIAGVDPARVQMAQLVVSAYFDGPDAPLRALVPLKDALLEVWPAPDGLAGRARIRLR
jgi:hypothetical protein